jgi:hypothetical protein
MPVLAVIIALLVAISAVLAQVWYEPMLAETSPMPTMFKLARVRLLAQAVS